MELSPCYNQSQGLAFCFTADDGLVGIDLDHCIVNGVALAWCLPILDRFKHTYIELSPSLSGVKIYCQGTLPDGLKPSVAIDDDSAIEMWSHDRFFAFTGLHLDGSGGEAEDCQGAIDWLIAEYGFEAERRQSSVPPTAGPSKVCQPVGTLAKRMQDYADACEAATTGGRHRALYRACAKMWDFEHLGELPTNEMMVGVARDINARFRPPLEDDQVIHTVECAYKYRQDRPASVAWLREHSKPDPGVDLSGIRNGSSPAPPNPTPRVVEQPFPRSAIEAPGFVGEFVDWCCRTAIYPQPQLAVAGALSLLGAICGRKISGPDGQLRTNIYILGVAPAGSGKEHIRRCVKQLLLAADRPDYSGPERLVSSAGLVAVVKKHKSILLMLDEIGKLLATMQDQRQVHLYAIGSVMLQMYTSSDILWIGDAYADERKTPKIEQPNLCLFGTTTGSSLWPKLSLDNVSDGLLPRMGLVEGSYVDPRQPEHLGVPNALVQRVLAWDYRGDLETANPAAVQAQYDEDAISRHFAHMQAIARRRKDEDEYRSAIWTRVAERTGKLALLFACSRAEAGPETVKVALADVDRAVELSNWMARRLIDRVAGYQVCATNPIERDVAKVLQIIRQCGPISRRDLSRKTQWLRRRERDEIVTSLMESEQIACSISAVKIGNGAEKLVEFFSVF